MSESDRTPGIAEEVPGPARWRRGPRRWRTWPRGTRSGGSGRHRCPTGRHRRRGRRGGSSPLLPSWRHQAAPDQLVVQGAVLPEELRPSRIPPIRSVPLSSGRQECSVRRRSGQTVGTSSPDRPGPPRSASPMPADRCRDPSRAWCGAADPGSGVGESAAAVHDPDVNVKLLRNEPPRPCPTETAAPCRRPTRPATAGSRCRR